jgi:hypothetical protein
MIIDNLLHFLLILPYKGLFRGVWVRFPVGSRIFSSARHPDRLWGPPSGSWEPPVTQLIKNFSTFYEIRRFIIMFKGASHWSLSWARWILYTLPHPISLKINFNIILQPTITDITGMNTAQCTHMYTRLSLLSWPKFLKDDLFSRSHMCYRLNWIGNFN